MGIIERREREKERRKQQIIVAAKRVFLENGFNKATMEDIAKEAELSAGTLYLYFKNKHELYASITMSILQFINMRLTHIKSEKSHLSPEEKLEIVKQIMLDAYDFDPLALTNLFLLQSGEILNKLSGEFITEISKITKGFTDGMAELFVEGMEKGIFVEGHPIALADIMISLFSGIVLWEGSKKTMDSEKDYMKPTFELAFAVFSRGLIKSKPDIS